MSDLVERIAAGRTPIAVVGLGYVGMPLAVAFGRRCKVIGFDISAQRIDELRRGIDRTGELSAEDLEQVRIEFSSDPEALRDAAFHIVAVPTPIDASRKPDLRPLVGASETIGPRLAPGDIVVFESTVYPGVTEEICGPILARTSGLRCGVDFHLGYSPERINPGDPDHRVETIVKVVSGQNEAVLDTVARVYELVIRAGVYRCADIRTAEAAKVIENTQRDLNIGLMNELSIIFDRLGIDSRQVLAAAGTKWNFLPFRPGLVGGHCIGVDPYYLTFKAEEVGIHPQVILAARRINDGMGKYVAEATVKELIKAGKVVQRSRVLILGLTFKENVPDLRNSRVVDIIRELGDFDVDVLVHDPHADPEEARREMGVEICDLGAVRGVDGIIAAVAHDAYRQLDAQAFRRLAKSDHAVFIDVRSLHDRAALEAAGFRYWSL
ncbi:MAG: nucleotide sugar dehydrogenase [Candidatus Eiseniibacteriota bacterium]